MKDQLIKSHLEIRRSTQSGYGVYALKNFKQGEIIEECPTLLLNTPSSDLTSYIIPWKNNVSAIPLGYGCIYNRAELPNATYDSDENNQVVTFKALKNIYKGDEIFVYYASTPPSSIPIKSKISYHLTTNLPALLLRIGFVLLLFFIFKTALFSDALHQKNLQQSTQKQSKAT